MIYEFDSFAAYRKACEENPGLRGLSPGGTSASLKIGRQGVYTACRRGSLDLCRIWENGEGPFLIVTEESVKRYREKSLGKVGGPRVRCSSRQALTEHVTMAVDKVVHGVWPNDS